MIQEFVDRYTAKKGELAEKYRENAPSSYKQLVEDAIALLHDESFGSPDSSRITCIDHGEYQGTLVFVIAAEGYQPSTYWYVRVYYGSCSGCDAFQKITERHWRTDATGEYMPDVEKQVQEFMNLSLQIVQRIKQMDEDSMF